MPQPVTTPSVSGRFVLDAEAVRAVAGEHVELDEGAGVEQQVDALAGGELAALVLAPDRRFGPGVQRLFLQLGELLEALGDRVRGVGHAGQASSRPAATDRSGPPRRDLLLDEFDQSPERRLRMHERDVVPRLPGRGASSMTR